MRTPSTDIFGPVEENNDENIEEEEQEEEEVEEEQEEEPEEEETSNSEEEEEADDGDEPDPWSPLRHNVGEETYLKEVQQFLDRGKSQHYAENAAFNVLLPVSRRL